MEDTFKGNDNKSYVLSPLTLGDNKRFAKWVQYKRWEKFQSLKDVIPADQFVAESARLLTECNSKDLHESSPEVTATEHTLEGISYWIHLSLKHTYPDMSLEQTEDILTGNNVMDVWKQLAILSGLLKKTDLPKDNPNSDPSGSTMASSTAKDSKPE